ncbi:MAG: extracellular solute-binding protein, partial [Planctomycetia bacterium]|nr:extracellular solute-binding protein [Planctomycetia bacterium]
NENIQNEFTWAFSNFYAANYGRRVHIEWRNVGGGGSTIVRSLRNMYSRDDSPGIDILWGGGEFPFQKLADEGLLTPLKLSDDVLQNIPATLGGLEMYDPRRRWCGSAVSGFGFIFNATMLRRCGIEPPRRWEDLASPRFAGLLALADPTQSGSAAATYEMIVQSAPSWPEGWVRLLSILANARRFTDSAGDAANSPALGEALVATCMDFYGAIRVAEAPDELVYLSPAGQTAFSPDPIAILKNPPHPLLARRFVDFVLSRRGQALWALRVGEPDGPLRRPLGRQPIRRDVYRFYAGRMSPWIVNPYEAVGALKIDPKMRSVRFGVLRSLVRAAAVDNRTYLRAAYDRLIASGYERDRLAEFSRLPRNVSTHNGIAEVAKRLKDPTEAELIVTAWTVFFREKYRRVAE